MYRTTIPHGWRRTKNRVGCQDEPDSLSHYNEFPLLYNFVTAARQNAAILPRTRHPVSRPHHSNLSKKPPIWDRCVPVVLDLLLVFCASFATGYVRLKDFTLKVMNKRVELDVRMSPTLFLITTNALSYTICLLLCGDRQLCFHGEAIFSLT